MKTAEIRNTFLQYFADKAHTVVDSSPLIPLNDPTLMFTNSGMVQFKDVFLGFDKRAYVRAASCQACLRAGGKHNDLENVGYTARHHTFFEMLGNWSFGDYFKESAIIWSWELLTKIYKLDPQKLMATVYIDDDEAFNIWTKTIGLPENKVVRIGDNKGKKYASDNFWMMADTGPCGPCSEIFYDHGENIPGGPPGSADEDGDRFIEIWNLVFMQYDMKADGSLVKLPAQSVDTGLGLERLAAILQNKHSNYQIDLFESLIAAAYRETIAKINNSQHDINSPSLKVLADHIRACAFLIVDGVHPGNEGAGYVLRRITRRAIRHGYKLGVRQPFFYKLVPDLIKQMGDVYPRLSQNQKKVEELLLQEESRFFQTIANGMEILENEIKSLNKSKNKIINGEIAFKLHDTYGFPIDLTSDICREHNLSVDVKQFELEMSAQKNQARSAQKTKASMQINYEGAATIFCGYEKLTTTAKVLAIYRENNLVQDLSADEEGLIILDTTPFYAESGGQVGDVGTITLADNNKNIFMVNDCQKVLAKVFGHYGKLSSGKIKVGYEVIAKVNIEKRAATMRHHSVTHIMHKALRQVLGGHVAQKGSLVDSEKTRFDFSHDKVISEDELRQIELLVNLEIIKNTPTTAEIMALELAKNSGAQMLFGEKYEEEVRVLTIGSSKELCGGTHVKNSGDIGLFKIISQSGVAAGIRRVEAVCGIRAINFINERLKELSQIAQATKSPEVVGKIFSTVVNLQNEKIELNKEINLLKSKLANLQSVDISNNIEEVAGIKLLTLTIDSADNKILRECLDKYKGIIGSGVVFIASELDEKVNLICGVTKDLTDKYNAGEILNFVAKQIGGKGGGRADMAMGSGINLTNLPQALQSIKKHLNS